MILKLFVNRLIFILIGLSTHLSAQATVVRMDFALGDQSTGSVYVELLDADAPLTVANFLDYIENSVGDRRYDGTFIHRSIRPPTSTLDVIQGGGYRFVSETGLPVAIPKNLDSNDNVVTVVNEFNPANSNVRGTLAMAKLGGQPDSATSEWFFNVIDNSSGLDDTPQDDVLDNGGFTVFGRVLGNGMDTVDAIAAIATEDLGDPTRIFTDVPTINRPFGGGITDANLVTLLQVVVNPPARAFVDTTALDYGLVGFGGFADQVITVQNIGGTDDLVLGAITLPGVPFFITDDQCSSRTLTQTQSCQITVRFQPDSLGEFQDSLIISTSDADNAGFTITLSGNGANATATLEVNPGASIDFGSLAEGAFSEQLVTVRNIGSGNLQPGIPTVSGAGAPDYEILGNNCLNITLALGETCTFTLRLTGNTRGDKSATLLLDAQPVQSVQITLSGEVVASQANLFLVDDGREFVFGDVQSGVTGSEEYPILNLGPGDLTLNSIKVVGLDADEFKVEHSCGVKLTALDTLCSVTVIFSPVSLGTKSVSLEIRTNDPNTPLVNVPIVATASQDNDGVPDAIESAGPNGGDGNGDGIPDNLQQNVTSMPDINGDYIILESDVGTRLTSVRADENPAPDTSPTFSGAPIGFNNGFFYFTIEGVPAGGAATVTMYFPNGVSASNYFKYSPAANAWFVFDYDPDTGIGAEILSDRIILHFLDGQLGDEDRDDSNGIIVDPGGPATIDLSGVSSSGGGGGGCSLSVRSGNDASSRHAVGLVALLLGLLIWRAIGYAVPRTRITDRTLTYGTLPGTERPEPEPAGQPGAGSLRR